MILIHEPDKWWKHLFVSCQFCGRVYRMEGKPDEVQVAEAGDYKDESKLVWLCPGCRKQTYTTYSRMLENHKPLHEKYKGLVN